MVLGTALLYPEVFSHIIGIEVSYTHRPLHPCATSRLLVWMHFTSTPPAIPKRTFGLCVVSRALIVLYWHHHLTAPCCLLEVVPALHARATKAEQRWHRVQFHRNRHDRWRSQQRESAGRATMVEGQGERANEDTSDRDHACKVLIHAHACVHSRSIRQL